MGLSYAFGTVLEKPLAIQRIRDTYEVGSSLFDTVEVYVDQDEDGDPVVNEEVVGEALREAIFNAIIHKDYGSLNPIQISIHPDSIYIANNAYFPEQRTPEQIFQKHQSRLFNPLIASTLFRAGRIEAWGRGISYWITRENNDMAKSQRLERTWIGKKLHPRMWE